MPHIILQRFAVQRRIAEQLEAVSLDEVLRRMQSSSLTNPARSLEAHFVLAAGGRDHEPTAPPAASPGAEDLGEPSGALLRNALSERLLAEVRRDLSAPAITLDDLAALVHTVEQHWRLFIDHGTSTTGLLVQFTALALVLTGCASTAAAEPEPGSNLVNSLRRLGHLQTDRALLQQRVFSLCDAAIGSLCSQDEEAAAAGDGGLPPRRGTPWWYRPQELVRLSQAMRLIELYEAEQRRGSGYSSGAGSPVRHSSRGDGDGPRGPGGSAARALRRDTDNTTLRSSNLVRSALPSRAHTASALPKARWLLRLPTTWWPASSTPPHGAAVGHQETEAAVRARRRLAAYVTYHALRRTSTVPPPPMPSYAVSPALASVSLADVEGIFAVVCSTASSVASTEAVTAFSWWVRDVFLQQHRHRSLHDAPEMAGLLGIAEVCVAYPDGTQTVLAEALKCLQRSALLF